MDTNNKDLLVFNNVCDEFIEGKYILAEVKIAELLKVIAEQERLKNIVAMCSDKFDFNFAYKAAVSEDENGNQFLTLPEDEKDIVAFVFSLLYRLDNKTINVYKFASNFYKENDSEPGKEFKNLTAAIIVPFKDAVNKLYSTRHIVAEAEEYKADYFNKIMSTIQLIAKNMDNFRLKINEKEEFTILLNALYIASENSDKKQVFAIMIGLDYFTKANKRARNAYLSLEECFSHN